MSASLILASAAPEISRKIPQSRGSGDRHMSHPTTTFSNSFMAFRGYSIHTIRDACLVLGNLAIYLSLPLMIRCVSAAPAGTASDNSNISPAVIIAIVAACLGLPSAIWALLQVWQWFSGDNSSSPSGSNGNQVPLGLQSNSGAIGNIHGGNFPQNEDPSRLGNRCRGVSPLQEGSEKRDALPGTPSLSPSTTCLRSSQGEEGLELRELNGRTASPYYDQQRATGASMTVDGATPLAASQTRMDLPTDEDDGPLFQSGALACAEGGHAARQEVCGYQGRHGRWRGWRE